MARTTLPTLGFGTYKNTDPEACANAVATALETGYRHIDTAQYYENESYVGEGLSQSSVDVDDVFVATKLWHDQLAYDDAIGAARESRDRLGVDSIDLLYVHWPANDYDPEATLSAFSDLVSEGVIEHVGVSNFTPDNLDEAREHLDTPIFADQVELHPLLQQDDLRAYAREHDLPLVAYSPLARGDVFEVEELTDIAEKHGVSEAQVSLAWLCGLDNVHPIPKATGTEHIEDNYVALDLTLDAEDREKIEGIEQQKRTADPSFAPDW